MNGNFRQFPTTMNNFGLRCQTIQTSAIVLIFITLCAATAYITEKVLPQSDQSLALLILIMMVLPIIAAFFIDMVCDFIHLQQNGFIPFTASGEGLALTDISFTARTSYLRMGLVIGLWMYAGYKSMSTLAGEVTNPQVFSRVTIISVL